MSLNLIRILIEVGVLLVAVSFHESAHGYVAMKCGDNTARNLGRISLNPLRHIDPVGSVALPLLLALSGAPVFGWAKPVPVSLRGVPHPRRANLLVAAAGPLSNLLLAALSAWVVVRLRPYLASEDAGLISVLIFLVAVSSLAVNAALGLFNLLPIPPLDGFGVLESLLPTGLLPLAAWLRRWGMAIFVLAIFSGVLRTVLLPAQRFLVDSLLAMAQAR